MVVGHLRLIYSNKHNNQASLTPPHCSHYPLYHHSITKKDIVLVVSNIIIRVVIVTIGSILKVMINTCVVVSNLITMVVLATLNKVTVIRNMISVVAEIINKAMLVRNRVTVIRAVV